MTATDGKPIWETSFVPQGSVMRSVEYFDTQQDAHNHLARIVGKPVRVKKGVNTTTLAASPVPPPFKRPGWRQHKDGSYHRKKGDVVGSVRETRHGGSFVATFHDGHTFQQHEFSISGWQKPVINDAGNPDTMTRTFTTDERLEAALQWVDDHFASKQAQAVIAKPLTERQKKLRDNRIARAMAAGQVDPAMTTEQRVEAAKVASRLSKPAPPDPAKITVLDDPTEETRKIPRGKAGVFGRSAGGREGRAQHPVPLLPPNGSLGTFGEGDAASSGNPGDPDHVRPVDEGLTATGYTNNRMEVFRNGRKIGEVRRLKRERPDGKPETIHFVDVPGQKPGKTPYVGVDSEWQAQMELLRWDKKGDAQRAITGDFPMPDGFAPYPNMAGPVSSRIDPRSGDRLVAIRTERIGKVKKITEKAVWRPDPTPENPKKKKRVWVPMNPPRWAIFVAHGPSIESQPPTERAAVERLVAAHLKHRKTTMEALEASPILTPDAPPEPVPTERLKTPRTMTVTDEPGGVPHTVRERPVVLSVGAGKAPKPDLTGVKPAAEAVTEFMDRGDTNLPLRKTKPKQSSTGNGYPSSNVPRPLTVRNTYDSDTVEAVNKFEASTKVSMAVRDSLRLLEISGTYHWVFVSGDDMPNGQDGWVFTKVDAMNADPYGINSTGDPSARGLGLDNSLSNIGTVLALSQPELDNYIYSLYLINATVSTSPEWAQIALESLREELESHARNKKRKALLDDAENQMDTGSGDNEVKLVRHIRTPEGAAKYGGSIGDVIALDPTTGTMRAVRPGSTPTPSIGKAPTPGVKPSVTPSGHPKPKKRVKVEASPKAKLRRDDTQTPSGNPKPKRSVTPKPDAITPKDEAPAPKDEAPTPKPTVEPKPTTEPTGPKRLGPKDETPAERMKRLEARTHEFWDGETLDEEGMAAKLKAEINPKGRPDGDGSMADPILCGTDVYKAMELILAGKHVRLETDEAAGVLIDELAIIARDAKRKKEKAPKYDLCLVSVRDKNLFCAENKGHERVTMPQLTGVPFPGSFAETRPDPFTPGEAKVENDVLDVIRSMGIKVEERDGVPAENYKASQRELDGAKVADMASKIEAGKMFAGRVLVTADGYVVDGHHRWAAYQAADAMDGRIDHDSTIDVIILDMDIGMALDVIGEVTAMMGIKPKSADASQNDSGKTTFASGEMKSLLESLGFTLRDDYTCCP